MVEKRNKIHRAPPISNSLYVNEFSELFRKVCKRSEYERARYMNNVGKQRIV